MKYHGFLRSLFFSGLYCVVITASETGDGVLDLDGKLSLGESAQPLLLLGRLETGLVLGQSLSHGASLLHTQVNGNVLLALKAEKQKRRVKIGLVKVVAHNLLFK